MKMKILDGTIRDCMEDIKSAVAETNKMVLTKRDINKLRAIRKRIEFMTRQLDELYAFVSTRLYKGIGELDDSDYPKTED